MNQLEAVGVACGVSPTVGRQEVRVARDLHAGPPRVRALFAAGALDEHRVGVIVAATAGLDPSGRSAVDPQAFRRACATARTGRRVTVRPAADGMADLTAHLPVNKPSPATPPSRRPTPRPRSPRSR